MAFRYRLEALLRLQRSVEHQEENRLLACAARVAGLNAELRAWEALRRARINTVWSDSAQGTPGIFLQFAAEWDDAACQREKEIHEKLKVAHAERQKQMQVYREARQKREILEGLKERQESAFTTEQLRRLQQGLDEAHLLQLFYENSG